MSKQHFIKTSDPETAELLRKTFNEVEQNGKYFIFVNDTTMRFSSEVDQSKIMYTNKLCI